MNVYYKEVNKSSIGNNHFYVGWSPININFYLEKTVNVYYRKLNKSSFYNNHF